MAFEFEECRVDAPVLYYLSEQMTINIILSGKNII
jgi:hypothetical protein